MISVNLFAAAVGVCTLQVIHGLRPKDPRPEARLLFVIDVENVGLQCRYERHCETDFVFLSKNIEQY